MNIMMLMMVIPSIIYFYLHIILFSALQLFLSLSFIFITHLSTIQTITKPNQKKYLTFDWWLPQSPTSQLLSHFQYVNSQTIYIIAITNILYCPLDAPSVDDGDVDGTTVNNHQKQSPVLTMTDRFDGNRNFFGYNFGYIHTYIYMFYFIYFLSSFFLFFFIIFQLIIVLKKQWLYPI